MLRVCCVITGIAAQRVVKLEAARLIREAVEPFARMHEKPYSSNLYIKFKQHMAECAKIADTGAATVLHTALPTAQAPKSAGDPPAPGPATEDSGR